MAATVLLSVQEATLNYADKILFKDLNFHIADGEKICLIGKNGTGKTTLMNVIAGTREVNEGLRWQLQGIKIGYLPQDVPATPEKTVRDYVLEGIVPSEDMPIEHYQYQLDYVAMPLQLDINATLDTLSGGQLRRAALARALVEAPDVLLLDEPTNHLDLEVIGWLENYLKNYRGSVLCVSHDKTFLANISNKVFWLDRGQMRVCPRGYAYFAEWSQMILDQEQRTLENRSKFVESEIEWAKRGVKARLKRNTRRQEQAFEEAANYEADLKAFRRVTRKIKLPPLKEQDPASQVVAEFYNVCKDYGADPVIKKLSLKIRRGDRIGILGKNGAGKSTMIKMLIGDVEPSSGTVKVSKTTEFAYFDQQRELLKPNMTLRHVLSPNGGDYIDVMGKTRHVCGYLKDFLFDPADIDTKVETLSGGQKNRLLLARVLANPGNFLILDEPTNDLDMDTLEMLETILAHYNGTMMIVSHDRDFLDQTVQKVLAFEGQGRVDVHLGGYTEYLAVKEQEAEKQAKKNPPKLAVVETPKPVAVEKKKITYKVRYEWEQLPKQIEAMQTEIKAHEAQLADPALYTADSAKFTAITHNLEVLKAKLEVAEMRWLELDEEVQAAGG